MNRVQSGGGMPSMDELMSDPSLRDLYVYVHLSFSLVLWYLFSFFQGQ